MFFVAIEKDLLYEKAGLNYWLINSWLFIKKYREVTIYLHEIFNTKYGLAGRLRKVEHYNILQNL